jgi:uncharacterized protein YggE
MSNSTKSIITIMAIVLSGVLFVSLLISLINPSWGQLTIAPAATVTVSGSAKSQVSHQLASFNIGVTSVSPDKQVAVDQVNSTMKSVIDSIKQFGIKESDIQTQSVSVFQEERYDPDQNESNITGWRASNSIDLTLREIDRTSELTDLLSSTDATNVSGPNFRTDDTQTAESELVGQAIANARQKALAIAQASGKSLGEVISVTEGQVVSGPMPMMALEAKDIGGIPAPIEPGSATISQSVTVVFSLD